MSQNDRTNLEITGSPLDIKISRREGPDPGVIAISITLHYEPDDGEARRATYRKLLSVLKAVVPEEDWPRLLDELHAAVLTPRPTSTPGA